MLTTEVSVKELTARLEKELRSLEKMESSEDLSADSQSAHKYQFALRKLVALSRELVSCLHEDNNVPIPPPRRSLGTSDARLLQFQEQLNHLELKNKALTEKLVDAMESISNLEKERNVALRDSIAHDRRPNVRHSMSSVPLNSSYSEDYGVKRTIANYKERLAVLEQQVSASDFKLSLQYSELKVKYDMLLSDIAENKAFNVDPAIWQNIVVQLDQLESVLAKTREQTERNKELEEEIAEITRERNLAFEKVDELISDVERLKKIISSIRDENESLAHTFEADRKKTEEALEKQKSLSAQQEETIKSLARERNQLKEQVNHLTGLLAMSMTEKENAQHKNKELQHQLEETMKRNADLVLIEKEYSAMQAHYLLLQENAKNVETTLVVCKDDIDRKELEMGILRGQVEELRQFISGIAKGTTAQAPV